MTFIYEFYYYYFGVLQNNQIRPNLNCFDMNSSADLLKLWARFISLSPPCLNFFSLSPPCLKWTGDWCQLQNTNQMCSKHFSLSPKAIRSFLFFFFFSFIYLVDFLLVFSDIGSSLVIGSYLYHHEHNQSTSMELEHSHGAF